MTLRHASRFKGILWCIHLGRRRKTYDKRYNIKLGLYYIVPEDKERSFIFLF